MADEQPIPPEILSQRYWRRAQAAVVVHAWRDSGLPLTRFAADHGLKAKRIRYWSRLLAEEEPGGAESPTALVPFAPVRMVPPAAVEAPALWAMEVELVNGRKVRIGRSFDACALSRLLEVLEC